MQLPTEVLIVASLLRERKVSRVASSNLSSNTKKIAETICKPKQGGQQRRGAALKRVRDEQRGSFRARGAIGAGGAAGGGNTAVRDADATIPRTTTSLWLCSGSSLLHARRNDVASLSTLHGFTTVRSIFVYHDVVVLRSRLWVEALACFYFKDRRTDAENFLPR